MRVFDSLDAVPAGVGPSAVAVGKLDGVHIGHQKLLDEVVRAASERSLASIVVTFDRNPLEVIAPERCPRALMPLARRLELIESFGVDRAIVLPFTVEMANKPPEWFAREVIAELLAARLVFAGPGFRFGRGGAGDLTLLREIGREQNFAVVEVDPVRVDGDVVSSTAIRERLTDGDVAGAARMLGRTPEVAGVVVHGLRRGRELGFPTANLGQGPDAAGRHIDVTGFIPGDGVYAGVARIDDGPARPAAISVGTNPTFENVERTVEAYLLDTDEDLYGRGIRIGFDSFVRPMLAFASRNELIEQMHSDVIEVRRRISERATAL